MRSTPTPAERQAQLHLFQHLLLKGEPAQTIERQVMDRPDLAFVSRGKRIACEIVQIPDHEIIRWHHKRHAELMARHDRVRCITTIWPIEPHSWVRKAIDSKKDRIDQYRNAVGSDEVWLYIHAHDEHFMEEVYQHDTIPLMYVGTTSAKHGFDRIIFYDKRCGVQDIFFPGIPTYSKTTDLSPGYPAVALIQYAGAPFTTTEADEPPRIYEYDVEETITIKVDPIDPTFKARGKPNVRIRPAKRIIITAYSDRAETKLIFD